MKHPVSIRICILLQEKWRKPAIEGYQLSVLRSFLLKPEDPKGHIDVVLDPVGR